MVRSPSAPLRSQLLRHQHCSLAGTGLVTDARPLIAAELQADPSLLTRELQTGPGLHFTARLLRAADRERLGAYFDSLTDAVTGMYGPHPLNTEHARVLCNDVNYAESLRFVVDIDGAIQGYFILDMGLRPQEAERYVNHGTPLHADYCCTFAPSVADAYLEQGVGTALMPLVMEAARRLGRSRIVLMGGVRGDNPRAQHFYRKHGFVEVGHFTTGGDLDNLDMALDLKAQEDR